MFGISHCNEWLQQMLAESVIAMHDCIKWLSNRPELQDLLFHYLTARGKQVLLAAVDRAEALRLQVQNLASRIGAAADDC